MRCPVCRIDPGYYRWPAEEPDDPEDLTPYPLYQRSYPGKSEHIPPRCSKCYDKAERVRMRKYYRNGR